MTFLWVVRVAVVRLAVQLAARMCKGRVLVERRREIQVGQRVLSYLSAIEARKDVVELKASQGWCPRTPNVGT